MKIMKKIFSLFLFFLFLCVNQELIAFAEIANVKTEEQIDNNTSNEFELSSRISNPKLLGREADFQVISDYHIIGGDDFKTYYPFLGGTDEFGRKIDFSDLKVFEYYPARPGRPGRYQYSYTDSNKRTIFKGVDVTYVKEDGRRAKLKDDEVFVGEDWSLDRVFEDVRDKYGTRISGNTVKRFHSVVIDNIVNKQDIETRRPGIHTVYIGIANPNTYPKVWSDTVTVTVKVDQTTVRLKDTELYVGEKWDPNSVFEIVMDKYGNNLTADQVDYYWIDHKLTRDIDTSKPGEHVVEVGVYDAAGKKKESNEVKVKVKKKDQTSLKTRDSTIYVGQKWNPKDNFVSATDEVGKSVPWEDPRITMNNANIDTSKPGIHKIKYTFKEKENIVDSSFTVTVKEDKTKAELKDTELYVGEKWELGSVFKNVVDKDGNPIKPENVEWVWVDDNRGVREIDTSKPGKHTVYIAIKNAQSKWIHSNTITVTVKEEPFTINQVPGFDFDEYILGLTNKVINKKEDSTIELETPSIVGKDWQLQVELSPFIDRKNEKNALKGASLFIPKGKLESDLEKEEPNQYECQLEANGKASILMSGMKTKGKGHWKNKLETKGITLSIPSENKKGDFESTLHWTLLDVPT
ncbi:bacterial Ig-like domain-containing protein [Enterococcus faecalis]